MRKVLIFSMALFALSFSFTSCEKTITEPTVPFSSTEESIALSLLSPEASAAFAEGLQRYWQLTAENNENEEGTISFRGANFITPFFTNEGFVLVKDLAFGSTGIVSGELAGFSADLDGNDFYRENPDGTVSVHITSNKAYAEHFDFATGVATFGSSGRMTMNYTGEVIEFTVPDFGTIRFIDANNSSRSIVWQGTAKVPTEGVGPFLQLKAHLTDGPGQPSRAGFSLR